MNVEAVSMSMGLAPVGSGSVRAGAAGPGSAPPPDLPAHSPSGDAHSGTRAAIAEANRQLAQKASELTFEFDESAARVIVRLIDKQTGQVLRQIPSKEAIQIARALQDESAGALLRTDA